MLFSHQSLAIVFHWSRSVILRTNRSASTNKTVMHIPRNRDQNRFCSALAASCTTACFKTLMNFGLCYDAMVKHV